MNCKYKHKVGKYTSDNVKYVKKEDDDSKEIGRKFKHSITSKKKL